MRIEVVDVYRMWLLLSALLLWLVLGHPGEPEAFPAPARAAAGR